MANRTFMPIYGADQGLIRVGGSFRPQGTGAPIINNVAGGGTNGGFTVTRQSAGLYLVSFVNYSRFGSNGDAYGQVLSAQVTLALASFTNLVPGLQSLTTTSFVISIAGGSTGTLTDIAANPSNVVHFEADCSLETKALIAPNTEP